MTIKRIVCFVLLLLVVLLPMSARSDDAKSAYTKANIYYFNWYYLSDSFRTIAETRKEYREAIYLSDPVVLKPFVAWLKLDGLKEVKDIQQHHALLVIDLIRPDNTVDTYYSDGCSLYSADSRYMRPIDGAFRNQFAFSGTGDLIMHTAHKDYHLCDN